VSLKIRFVCATRQDPDRFDTATALGRSLAHYQSYSFVELKLFPNNSRGLPALYNQALREAADDPAILVFVHDDIHLCDFFWPNHLVEALSKFDVVGLAGNKRRVGNQPGWAFIDDRFTWDAPENFSGIVAHGTGFPAQIMNFFGFPGQEVKLLDGMWLAARSEMLLANDLHFDERFDFNFYDLDFCREAEVRKLRMGTCTVSVVHESPGNFDTPSWRSGYQKYLDKWKS
jgi:hypothetical protein